MAHGTPDWGLTAGTVTTYQLTDLAELAARLGSIDTFDRRGEVLVIDDFEATLLKWAVDVSGTGASVALSALSAKSGAQSVRLVAGSNVGRRAQIDKAFVPQVLSPIGLEFSFFLDANLQSLLLSVQVYDGAFYTEAAITLNIDTLTMTYLDENGNEVAFGSGFSSFSILQGYNTIKLVFDPSAGRYLRLLWNDTTYLSTRPACYRIANATSPYMNATIRAFAVNGTNPVVYVDDAIITLNEPL